MHSFSSALDAGEWSASCPGCFTPRERAPGTHWTGGWAHLLFLDDDDDDDDDDANEDDDDDSDNKNYTYKDKISTKFNSKLFMYVYTYQSWMNYRH
jgi:hypothetical protein